MRNLFKAIGNLAPWQKLVVALLLILIVLTWLAVCVLMGMPGTL